MNAIHLILILIFLNTHAHYNTNIQFFMATLIWILAIQVLNLKVIA